MSGRGSLLALVVVVLLAVSLGLKVHAMGVVNVGSDGQLTSLEAFLSSHGFVLRPDQRPAGPFVAAQKADCHLIVGSLSPRGWHQEVMRGMAEADDDLYFVVHGQIYPAQPTWRTRTMDAAARAMTAVGLPHPRPLVLGVIATGPCGSRSLPWGSIPDSAGDPDET